MLLPAVRAGQKEILKKIKLQVTKGDDFFHVLLFKNENCKLRKIEVTKKTKMKIDTYFKFFHKHFTFSLLPQSQSHPSHF